MMRSIQRSWNERLSGARETFGIWFFGDVIYAILPIITMAIIKQATGEGHTNFLDFLLTREWSFATIVFFGVSIRYLLEMKVRYERDQSHKLDTGTQFRILLVILSVLCLALVETIDKSTPEPRMKFIAAMQLTLFVAGLLTLLNAEAAKQSFIRGRWTIPAHMTRLRFMLHLENSLNTAVDNCDYFVYALSKVTERELRADNDFVDSRPWEETNYARIRDKIQRLRRAVDEMESALGGFTELPASAAGRILELPK